MAKVVAPRERKPGTILRELAAYQAHVRCWHEIVRRTCYGNCARAHFSALLRELRRSIKRRT